MQFSIHVFSYRKLVRKIRWTSRQKYVWKYGPDHWFYFQGFVKNKTKCEDSILIQNIIMNYDKTIKEYDINEFL